MNTPSDTNPPAAEAAPATSKAAPDLPAVNPATLTWRADKIPLEMVRPDPDQPRDHITPESVQEMAASLAANGLLEPILVLTPNMAAKKGDPLAGYTIIAGERRFRGAQKLKWPEIEARVLVGGTVAQAKIFALVENLHRENLNVMQEARGFAGLVKLGLTHEQIAAQVRVSRETITHTLRLLELPEKVQTLIREGELTAKHGVAILRFKGWPALMEMIAKCAADDQTPAERLRTGLPYSWRMHSTKPPLAREILDRELVAANVTKKELKEQRWFFETDTRFYTLAPNETDTWLKMRGAAHEKAQQEKAAEALRKHLAAVEKAKAAGKAPPPKPEAAKPPKVNPNTGQVARPMSAAEKRDRADKVAENKARRAKLEAAWAQAQTALKAINQIRHADVLLLCDWAKDLGAGTDRIHDEALAAMVALGLPSTAKTWAQLTPLELIKVTLWLQLQDDYESTKKYAGGIPEDMRDYAKGYEKKVVKVERAADKKAAAEAKPGKAKAPKAPPAGAEQARTAQNAQIVLLLRDGKKVAEIAKTLGVSLPRVLNLQYAARRAKAKEKAAAK